MHGRNIVALLVLTGLGSAGISASPGYLASIGPAPMRFLPAPAPARPPVAEPAPPATPATNLVATLSEPGPKPAETSPMKVAVPPEPPLSLIVSNAIGDFISGMKPDSQYVPPSVLVRYFTGHVDENIGGLSVPVAFRPPGDPPAPVRSSATYEKGP